MPFTLQSILPTDADSMPTAREATLDISGMNCGSCVSRVEKALIAVEGVSSASVNLATKQAHIEYRINDTDISTIVAAVKVAGYGAAPIEATPLAGQTQAEQQAEQEIAGLRHDLLLAAILTIPLFLVEMGGHLFPPFHHAVIGMFGQQTLWMIEWALATALLLGPGLRFYKQGLPTLLRGTPDMNALVMIGTAAAYLYSLVATFAPQWLPDGSAHIYYEAVAVIITLILLGRYLEARAKGKTSDAIRRLIGLQPQSAIVRTAQGDSSQAVSSLAPGDIIVLRPGERVPVDGLIIEGSSYIDESMISGEALPVTKISSDSVIAGTLNQHGSLIIRTTHRQTDSLLAHIIRLVQQAQGSKLPIQTLVDKITAWFVPAIIGIAALTFLIWLIWGLQPSLSLAVVNAVAVLIIACPCAMGLATPTSIMTGTGRAAELGILFRKGEALQILQTVKLIAFDKTGTLTLGKPVLTDMILTEGYQRADILAMIAAIEQRSEHPIAHAIVQAALSEELSLPAISQFEAIAGYGVKASIANNIIALGADRFMVQQGISIASMADTANHLAEQGKSPLYAAIDGKVAAILAVADPIRPTSPQAIAALQQQGIEIVMISGDNANTANAIARQLGISKVEAGLLPAGKIEAVARLQKLYGTIAFVGDGINDAPALAKADIGIAIGTGTDIAIEAADVVLMTSDVMTVSQAIALSRATMRNIRQNLFWAFGYNIALIPLAAGILWPVYGLTLSPMIAAGAMALSSVFVVSNALRLRRFQPIAGA